MKNSQLIKILELLKEAHSVLLFPHVQIDGDAFGSSLALCRVLRNEGKTAYIIMKEPVPQNMSFPLRRGLLRLLYSENGTAGCSGSLPGC